MTQTGATSLTAGTGDSGAGAILVACANRAMDAFRDLAGVDVMSGVPGEKLLGERAALTGTRPQGCISHGGSCRLLRAADGVLALNLPRDEDWQLLPAWLQEAAEYDWDRVARAVAALPTAELLDRGRLLGLAVVDATRVGAAPADWLRVAHVGPTSPPGKPCPRVVDLSSLWAGPLCSRLWAAAGAEVLKVESSRRPDGARNGPAEFFQLLNGGKQCLQLDLHTRAGQRELLELISAADIVLEASRPRAMRQMGIVAESIIDVRPGLTWVSITGYGREEPQANWIAYGDDAAIAAGLSAMHHAATGRWEVLGDAIADPLTGLHAALAGWASWQSGGGRLLDIALERTVRHCLTDRLPLSGDHACKGADSLKSALARSLTP